jgi:hypothetical protein
LPKKEAPPVQEERDTPQEIDIPLFVIIRKGIASGQAPLLDGFDWLKKHGYRTVLHIRAPGEENSAARKQFEAKGLRYRSLEVSAATLSKELLEEFEKLVMDRNNQPLFVYDKDSSLLGPLWYLHFRVYDKLSDAVARKKAESLGYRGKEPENTTMEIAINSLLSKILKK